MWLYLLPGTSQAEGTRDVGVGFSGFLLGSLFSVTIQGNLLGTTDPDYGNFDEGPSQEPSLRGPRGVQVDFTLGPKRPRPQSMKVLDLHQEMGRHD